MLSFPTVLRRSPIARVAVPALALAVTGGLVLVPTSAASAEPSTATPIKHLVVIFQENVSFDHYFGTYPKAANTDGTRFTPAVGTPSVNGLSGALLSANPNRSNPQRLGHAEALTCDQDHEYGDEQRAFDGGLMDKFVEYTNYQTKTTKMPATRGECVTGAGGTGGASTPGDYAVMDYYDGNTTTALWNYAQHYAMSDNSYGTTFGPSTPGALNLVSGQTAGAYAVSAYSKDPTGSPTTDAYAVPNQSDTASVGTVINDPDPAFDECSNPKFATAALKGRNVGDLLNAGSITWGWFQGGFRPTGGDSNGRAVCDAATTVGRYTQQTQSTTTADYSAHHEPFQYYRSTSNPHHLPPTGVIGTTDQANHQYDLADFDTALSSGQLPAVSFLKAKKAEDGHAGYSDPLDEQHFLVETINKLQKSPQWASTAVVIAYDDSDGWYDHQMSPIVNSSQYTGEDALNGPGVCGHGAAMSGAQLRCGYGPRLPLLVISPWSRVNAVDSRTTDQSSVLRFIEDNWLNGARIDGSFDRLAGSLSGLFDFSSPKAARMQLDPATGAVVATWGGYGWRISPAYARIALGHDVSLSARLLRNGAPAAAGLPVRLYAHGPRESGYHLSRTLTTENGGLVHATYTGVRSDFRWYVMYAGTSSTGGLVQAR